MMPQNTTGGQGDGWVYIASGFDTSGLYHAFLQQAALVSLWFPVTLTIKQPSN